MVLYTHSDILAFTMVRFYLLSFLVSRFIWYLSHNTRSGIAYIHWRQKMVLPVCLNSNGYWKPLQTRWFPYGKFMIWNNYLLSQHMALFFKRNMFYSNDLLFAERNSSRTIPFYIRLRRQEVGLLYVKLPWVIAFRSDGKHYGSFRRDNNSLSFFGMMWKAECSTDLCYYDMEIDESINISYVSLIS